MATEERRAGRCMCGAVQYSCVLSSHEVLVCHCEQCRRQSGHVWAAVHARGDLLEIDGADALAWLRDRTTDRGVCTRCGSFLFWRADGSPDVSIGVGTLEDASGLEIAAEIFLCEKAAYSVPAPEAEHYWRDRDEEPINR